MSRPFSRIALIGSALLCASATAGFGDMLKSAGGLLEDSGSAIGLAGSGASSLTEQQIDSGLKQALSLGAERAVAILGKSGGFLNDGAVRIPLPGSLQTVGKALRSMGQGRYVDQFETTVNRAAEQAVPQTLDIVKKTVQDMTLQDVQGILKGGDSAATDFLRQRAGEDLHQAIRPIVASATDQAGATLAYKNLVKHGAGYMSGLGGGLGGSLGGLLGGGDKQPASLDLDDYVTGKALDGLFLKLAAEEKAIRENPVARTTDLLKQVFAQ